MSSDNVQRIQDVTGVEAVSPQLFLASLANASCCSASELFMIAIDPTTDFTIQALDRRVTWTEDWAMGEGLGGNLVSVPEGDDYIKLYGYFVTLKGNLEPTGTGLDQTLFLTWETAAGNGPDLALAGREAARDPASDAVSAAMVRVKPGADPNQVALDISADRSGRERRGEPEPLRLDTGTACGPAAGRRGDPRARARRSRSRSSRWYSRSPSASDAGRLACCGRSARPVGWCSSR